MKPKRADKDFSTEQIRKTAKGWKRSKVHTVTVWHWDGKEGKACKRTLVITKYEKTKYSLSNGDKEKYTNKKWAYFQCSRYWVERCFDDDPETVSKGRKELISGNFEKDRIRKQGAGRPEIKKNSRDNF